MKKKERKKNEHGRADLRGREEREEREERREEKRREREKRGRGRGWIIVRMMTFW